MDHVAKAGEHNLERCSLVLHASRADVKAGDENEEPAERSQGEDIDNARALQFCIGNEVREWEGEQQAAHRRPGDVGELPDSASPGDRVDKMVLGDEMGNQR